MFVVFVINLIRCKIFYNFLKNKVVFDLDDLWF